MTITQKGANKRKLCRYVRKCGKIHDILRNSKLAKLTLGERENKNRLITKDKTKIIDRKI